MENDHHGGGTIDRDEPAMKLRSIVVLEPDLFFWQAEI
jgi:hypothetical protein